MVLNKDNNLTSFCLFVQWAVPFMILIVSIQSHLVISYLVSVAAGVSVAAAFLLPWWGPRFIHRIFSFCWFLSWAKCCLSLQVNASRCCGWLQSSESRCPRSWSPLLFFLCVLYQVCIWLVSRHFHSQFKVSLLLSPALSLDRWLFSPLKLLHFACTNIHTLGPFKLEHILWRCYKKL